MEDLVPMLFVFWRDLTLLPLFALFYYASAVEPEFELFYSDNGEVIRTQHLHGTALQKAIEEITTYCALQVLSLYGIETPDGFYDWPYDDREAYLRTIVTDPSQQEKISQEAQVCFSEEATTRDIDIPGLIH